MEQQFPKQGDPIIVDKSEWYALRDGERLRVSETAGWVEPCEGILYVRVTSAAHSGDPITDRRTGPSRNTCPPPAVHSSRSGWPI